MFDLNNTCHTSPLLCILQRLWGLQNFEAWAVNRTYTYARTPWLKLVNACARAALWCKTSVRAHPLNASGAILEFVFEIASIEPTRVRAYHDDLKWRIVHQRKVLGFSYKKIAENLGVDVSTAWKIVQHFQNTGTVTKKQYSRDVQSTKEGQPCYWACSSSCSSGAFWYLP